MPNTVIKHSTDTTVELLSIQNYNEYINIESSEVISDEILTKIKNERYLNIRSEKNIAKNKSIINASINVNNVETTKVNSSFYSHVLATSSTYGSAYLIDYYFYDFVPVTSGSKTYYGGNQSLYATDAMQRNGCGPTAAANILAYLALKDGSYVSNLYFGSNLSKSEFVEHMNVVYGHLDPPICEIVSENSFADDVVSLASQHNVSLNEHVAGAWTSFDNTVDFILTRLRADTPVAALNAVK